MWLFGRALRVLGPLLRVVAFVLVPVFYAAFFALSGHVDWAAIVLTIAVLVVGLLTLQTTSVGPARLVVQRQEELGLTDLIFYGTDEPETPGAFLLQLHVAVANLGGRTGVLSRLDLEEFLDDRGGPIQIYQFGPLAAQVFRQTLTYQIERGKEDRVHRVETGSPPLTLNPDDVVTLRFRAKRGIDWGERWTVGEIRKLVEPLERPIVRARLKMVYRRGTEIVTAYQNVDVQVEKQQEYVARLRSLTKDLTERPAIAQQNFPWE